MNKKLVRNSDTTISTQLFEILKQDILENRWKENDKFFSVRQISIKYSLNPNTVLKVVKALEEEGYLSSRTNNNVIFFSSNTISFYKFN